jgi:hypothetical protein
MRQLEVIRLSLWSFLVSKLSRGGADRTLARQGMKEATANKFGIYSTYSPHLQAIQKNSENCPSNQVSVAAMTFMSGEKWRPFNYFVSPGNM